LIRPITLTVVSFLFIQGSLHAVPPGGALLPGNSQFHLTVPDVQKLDKAWKKTVLSKLFDDPKIKPFFDEIYKESPLSKIGLNWADLVSIAVGELSVGMMPVAPGQPGHVLTLVSSEQKTPLKKVLAKAKASLEKNGYQVGTKMIGGVSVTTYTRRPTGKIDEANNLFSFTKDDILVAGDNEKALVEILKRWAGNSADRLDQKREYLEVLARARTKTTTPSDMFWFMVPLGLAETERTAAKAAPRRGPDLLKILQGEGFSAIKGIGGFVSLGRGEYDILQQTAIYAPGPYQKSMRMLKTLPGDNFAPPDWVPGDVTQFNTLYLDIDTAFKNFNSLFDAYYGEGDAGTFDDILKGLRDDPNGPRLDVGKDIISKLGKRVTLLADAEKPIGINSSRSLTAVETKDAKAVADGIRRLMENDDEVKKHDLPGGIVLWETITKEKKKKGAKPAPTQKAPNSGMAVAKGQLFVASDYKFLLKILTSKYSGLAGQEDFVRVRRELNNLGAGQDCARSFSRPFEDFQTIYEVLRTNQAEKAKFMYAQVLVNLFGDNLRRIDGSKYPPYESFRPYLGPTGFYVDNQTDGWVSVGCILRKQ
jgi:hypothetical protein